MSSIRRQSSAPTHLASQTIVSNAPAGSWQHPRMDEINMRLNKNTAGERQVKSLMSNVILVTITFSLPALLTLEPLTFLHRFIETLQPFTHYTIWSLRILAAYNILVALHPWVIAKDDLSDIPLTPTQRALLGLGPASKSATPGSHYITPPRYSKSTTPRSRSTSASPYLDSPLSGYGGSGLSNSPSASPLFQKAKGRDTQKRPSYGSSPPPFGLNRAPGQSATTFGLSTLGQAPSRNGSISLNNRWLYEKGKSSPSSLRSTYL